MKKKIFFEKVFEKALFFSLISKFICLYLIVKLTFNFKLKAKWHYIFYDSPSTHMSSTPAIFSLLDLKVIHSLNMIMNNWSITTLIDKLYNIVSKEIRSYSKDFLQVSSQYVNQREPNDLIGEILFSLNQLKQSNPHYYKGILYERLFESYESSDATVNNKLSHSIRLVLIQNLLGTCRYDDNYTIIYETFNSLIEWYKAEDLFD